MQFAKILIENCKAKGFNLCVRDDLLAGVSLDDILNLISERCNKVIILLSKALVGCEMSLRITSEAQTLGIQQKKQIIIPCLLEKCTLPPTLSSCYKIDCSANNKFYDCWERIYDTLGEVIKVETSAIQDRSSIYENQNKSNEKKSALKKRKNWFSQMFQSKESKALHERETDAFPENKKSKGKPESSKLENKKKAPVLRETSL